MQNKNPFKISGIFLLAITIALVWGIIFFSKFFPKEQIASDKSVLGSEETTTNSSHSLMPKSSNQWYTSLTQDFPSSPLYAMPLVFKTTQQGIGFSYPEIQKSNNTISAPYNEDFTIGFDDNFRSTKMNNIGDWTVNASLLTSDNKALTFTIGHGLPFAQLETNNQRVRLMTKTPIKVYVDNKEITADAMQTDALMLSVHNKFYIIAFPQKTSIQLKDNEIVIEPVEKIFVGILDKPEHFALFKQASNVTIVDSQASPQLTDNNLTVLYKLSTQNGTPLLALYPHQYDLIQSKQEILGSYQTIRGELRLVQTDNFVISFPAIMPDGTFAKLKDDYPDLTIQIKKDIQEVMEAPIPNSKDYFLGTWFGKISNLLLLADTYDLDKEKKDLLHFVEPIFTKSLNEFVYDKSKTSVIAKSPEFGNEELNDHHFHYGYYIRTAAVIANIDTPYLSEIKPQVDAMVSDIGTVNRDALDYPYLRNYDIYEGHSWADGKGDTPDGNNQESSSEAINAWYSLYLWGKITNDNNLQKNALYLYNMESQTAQYYWFNKNNIYGTPYTHSIASMVWGGKVDFATWFSKETNMIYGIQLLPITPASVYLGNLPDFAKYNADYQKSGGSETKDWGDLFTIWKSFYSPKETLKLKNVVNKPEANTAKSVFLYMLYANSEKKADEDILTSPTEPMSQ